jgi:CRP/FNR family transcriptional regulator, cyclic AMP receptor protein
MRQILAHFTDVPIHVYPDKTVILAEGDKSGRLYVLAGGGLEVLRGDTQIATMSEPGSLVGEMSALLDAPHTATVRTVGETRLHLVDDGVAFLAEKPELSWLVARLLARRLNAASTYLADLKRQFAGYGNHLEMVGEVLESLMHDQPRPNAGLGSDRDDYED